MSAAKTTNDWQLAGLIWKASRADEGTISAAGADVIAAAIVSAVERGELPQMVDGRKSMTEALVWMMDQPELSSSQSGTLYRFVHKCAMAFNIDLEKAVIEHASRGRS